MLNSLIYLIRRYETTDVKSLVLLCGFLLALRAGLALRPLYGQAPTAKSAAGFQLVDNFEGLTVGALNNQNGWHATSGVTVASDPANAANRVLVASIGNFQAYKALPTAIAADTSTGTLHFRLRRNGHIDGFAGASALAAPQDWSSFETQFGGQSAQAANEFVARDGAQADVLSNNFSDQTWYCVWLVTNNASDNYQVYVKGGAYAQPTQLNAAGKTLFSFRNGGSAPLLTFLTRVSSKSQGSLYLDDIYVDPTSQNLALPGNDCNSTSTDTTPPVVNWTSPVGNTAVYNVACAATVPLEVTATDVSGVNRVEFSRWDAVNSVTVPLSIDTTPPYQSSIDVCSLNMEWNEIDAHAFDNFGNEAIVNIWIYRTQPPPSAGFDAWPQSGPAPLTSSMHIVSLENINSCAWDYGDGTTGTSCAAYHDHIYTTAGTYTVKLTVSGPGGSNSTTRSNYISVTGIAAQFSATAYSVAESAGVVNIQVSLNAASGNVVSINYATANGTATAGSDYTTQSGTLTFNPGETVKTFSVPIMDDAVDEPDETVNLILSNPTNAMLGTPVNATLTILDNDNSLPPPPTVNFSANPTSGNKPLTVNFTDQSTGSITGWSWNFGDSGTSTQQTASHIYNNAGDYTVVLTVSGPGGSNTKTQTNYIHVSEPAQPPTADFSANPLSGNKPLTVNFMDRSTGNITSWSWNFGDGNTSTEQNPSHTYNNAGDYPVALTVSGPGGANTKTQANYIHVSEPVQPPTANFSANPLSGDKPLTVNFSDQSGGNITSWSWNFGDGATSTQQNPSHIYNAMGDYTVALSVSGPGGSNTKTVPNYIHVSEPLGLSVPTLNAIVNSEQDGNYVIAWPSIANVASYELQEQLNNGNWNTIYRGSATSYQLTSKTAGTWCYHIRSNNSSNNSAWSVPQCTTVTIPATAPSLALPDHVLALPGSTVVLPIRYTANGNNVFALLFSINYDQTKLRFNPIDSNGDGIPDAVQFSNVFPAGFITSVSFDANDTNAELDFIITDFSATPRVIPSANLVSITLEVLAASPVGVDAPVGFATASFGGTGGDIPGATDDGSVFVTDRLPFYLPLIRR